MGGGVAADMNMKFTGRFVQGTISTDKEQDGSQPN